MPEATFGTDTDVEATGSVATTGPPGVSAAVTLKDVGVPPGPGIHDRFTVRPLTVGAFIAGAPGTAGPATVRTASFDGAL